MKSVFKDNILIKGIEQQLVVEFIPQLDQLWAELIYYSDKSPAEFAAEIRSISNLSVTYSFNSKHQTQQCQVANSFENEFYMLVTEKISNLLRKFSDIVESSPISIEECLRAEKYLAAELPISYIKFLRLTNGFSGRAATGLFTFLSLAEIIEENDGRQYGEIFRLVIGRTAIGSIALIYNPNAEFYLTWLDENLQPKFTRIGSSFVEVLELLTE